MTRTIDTASLEHLIVRHCSPTLAALKPASLFTFPGRFDEGSRERAALGGAVAACGRELERAGISIRVLAWRPCGALVYVYRPDALAARLADPRARESLAARGYDMTSLASCLEGLASRLAAVDGRRASPKEGPCPCTERGCARDFPHELGFFLGYPYRDVAGFIAHEGRDYLAVGPWKVYADLDRALATFDRFRRCSAAYRRAHLRGGSLGQLAVITG